MGGDIEGTADITKETEGDEGTEEVTADNVSMTGGFEDSVETTTDPDNIVELTEVLKTLY